MSIKCHRKVDAEIARCSTASLGTMRLCVTLVTLLLASCTSTTPGLGRQLSEVTVSTSEFETLNVRIRNRSSRPLGYAWPIAMASADR
jgi:hypothetical protein